MRKGYFLGAYWGPRKESLDQCGGRLASFISRLASRSRLFAAWYETGWSRKDALRRKVDTADHNVILGLLEKGLTRRDDGQVFEDAGSTVVLWNGLDGEQSVGIDVHCGDGSPWIGNRVNIDLPEVLGRLSEASAMVAVVRDVVECWDPRTAWVSSELAMHERGFYGRGREGPSLTDSPFVDWILYLQGLDASMVDSCEGVRTEPVPGRGAIIVLAQRAEATRTGEHLGRVSYVTEILGRMGYKTLG